ncbi:MAG: magnesium transporter [Opitutaceae bacterium]|nr:magnesium transporter [Opitutaceae bacterium]
MSTHAISAPHAAEGQSIAPLVETPAAVFPPDLTVREATERIREIIKTHFVTYVYVVDARHHLLGIVTMRDLLLASADSRLEQIMLRDAFSLRPDMPLMDALKLTVNKHYPSYPVCTEDGHLAGIIWGAKLFAAQAVEISAQAGSMVGVDKEERTTTHWKRSLKFRHPWLQLNLLTAFVAAGVVGVFEHTIESIVVLAVFLPVLAGQSGNTGCQALAVALRGMTLGELKSGREKSLVFKEGFLGLLNGGLVGLTAGIGMYAYAVMQNTPQSPIVLGLTVACAMTASCIVSGIAGVMVPVTLRRFGADPATASSIFLTTATDVVSMGCFLGLATWWLL